MTPTRWQCPYCGSYTTINEGDRSISSQYLNGRSKFKSVTYTVTSTTCPNPECLELTVDIDLETMRTNRLTNRNEMVAKLFSRQLLPEGKVMVLPEAIPESIKRSYREAVLVLPISGAASAALARRCLQGMVRDFFDIPDSKRGDLGAELSYAKDKIDAQVWEDIFAVRSIGDIGAHMDKNVDFLIDVEPREAELLVALIEELFKVWYVERDRRNAQSAKLKSLLGEKRSLQREARSAGKLKDSAIPDDPPHEPEV